MDSAHGAKPSCEAASKCDGCGRRGYLVGDDGWSKPASLARAVFEFAQLVLHVLYFALCVLYFIELLFVKM